MKNIFKTFSLIIIVGVLYSCDDKIRSMDDLNLAPEFQFFRKGSVNWETPKEIIKDSAKVWSSSNNASYPAILRIMDVNNNISKINISSNDSENSFFVNGNTYFGNYEVDTNEEFNVAFRNSKPGTYEYLVTASDDFGKHSEMRFQVVFKSNKGPIASLSVILSNGTTKNYRLDAKNSHDLDSAIGGMIVEYEFIIDNIIIKTSEPIINHIFSIGKHDIKLRVKDSDDVWSDYVTYTLNVT